MLGASGRGPFTAAADVMGPLIDVTGDDVIRTPTQPEVEVETKPGAPLTPGGWEAPPAQGRN